MTPRSIPYPPPWQDISTLCAHICLSAAGVDAWVKMGLLPPPRMRGGKRLWKWAEVEKYLEGDEGAVRSSADPEAEGVRNATREAATRA